MKKNKRSIIKTAILIMAVLTTLSVVLDVKGVSGMIFGRKVVGKNIKIDDIDEFYFTYSSSTNPPLFRRYYLANNNGNYVFVFERREGDHLPLTEDDIVEKITVQLSDSQWQQFFDYIKDGVATKRKETPAAGGWGPYIFIYWNNNCKYQQFSFASYEKQVEFEEWCDSLLEK